MSPFNQYNPNLTGLLRASGERQIGGRWSRTPFRFPRINVGTSTEYWTTTWIDDETVSIKRGFLSVFSYDLTIGSEAVQQIHWNTWIPSAGGGAVAEDIVFAGLTDAHYLYVKVRNNWSTNIVASDSTTAGGDSHQHGVNALLIDAWSGANRPIIEAAANYTPSTDGEYHKYPFARFYEDHVLQLHTGIITHPTFIVPVDGV